MTLNYEYDTVSEALPVILDDLMSYGLEVGSRNGRVREFLNSQIVINESYRREVLSIGRGANVFAQIAETVWVLSGRNDVEWLSAYLPRAFDYADDGEHWRAGYGPRIRNFGGVDQLARVVDALKKDPLTRQAVIQIWDVSDGDTDLALKDRACNTQLQFQSRNGYLCLTVTVRSNDVMWGWSGINAFEWSTLQEIVASLLGINVGTLVFNVGSLHLYDVHWGKATKISHEALDYPVTRFNWNRVIQNLDDVDALFNLFFRWEARCRLGDVVTEDLSGWTEPLFKTWAAAIAYYWTRDEEWLLFFKGTALAVAVARTPASVLPEPVQKPHSGPVGTNPTQPLNEALTAFHTFVSELHAMKHESYGDSWKKRGEKLSILANIARKVDRLGVGDIYDSSADTWIDLWVYLAKYLCWLRNEEADPLNVNKILGWSLVETKMLSPIDDIAVDLDYYMDNVDGLTLEQKRDFVYNMIQRVAPIARDAWFAEDNYRGADHA